MIEPIDDRAAVGTRGPELDAQELLGALLASEARLRDQASILEMIAKGMPLDETLTEICRVFEAHIPGAACAVVVGGEIPPSTSADPTHPDLAVGTSRSFAIPAFTDGRTLGTLEVNFDDARQPTE